MLGKYLRECARHLSPHHGAGVDGVCREWLHSAISAVEEIEVNGEMGGCLRKMPFHSQPFVLRLFLPSRVEIRPSSRSVHDGPCREFANGSIHLKWSGSTDDFRGDLLFHFHSRFSG